MHDYDGDSDANLTDAMSRRGGGGHAVVSAGNGTHHDESFKHWANYDDYTMAECTAVVVLTFLAITFEYIHEYLQHKAGSFRIGELFASTATRRVSRPSQRVRVIAPLVLAGVETAYQDECDTYEDEEEEEEEEVEDEKPTFHVIGARRHFKDLFQRVK